MCDLELVRPSPITIITQPHLPGHPASQQRAEPEHCRSSAASGSGRAQRQPVRGRAGPAPAYAQWRAEFHACPCTQSCELPRQKKMKPTSSHALSTCDGRFLNRRKASGLCDHIIALDSILFNCSLLNSNQPIISHNYSLIQGHNSYFIVC